MTQIKQAQLHGQKPVATGQAKNPTGQINNAQMPIAVVGMSCRLSGGATSSEGLWQMVARGQSGWSRGDNSRFKMDSFYHPAKEIKGAFNARGICLLKQDISHFDNQFFNISPTEAQSIDPQQRLLLEVAYEAFENAGISLESLSNSETGVYCAMTTHDYDKILGRDPEVSPNHRYTGTGMALLSNRISYHFNLKGPSITLDTACSGGLVAIHEACKAIRSGEVSQVLVGGANLILDPEHLGVMSSLQFLSDHGRCYSFDSRANGLGRGEGVVAIVLKSLSDAIRDGDPIQSVIQATVVNQDGQTPSVTIPSQAAQVNLINRAYAEAGADPRDTCYVEAHGTGTQVGDKIEAGAFHETFCRNRAADSPLYIGSIKTNVGHTEGAAGLAGLVKSIMTLKYGKIPPNLNYSRSNAEIPLNDWQIKVPQKLLPWPENQVRRASVNSFGYGGTNAHVILEAPESFLSSYPHAHVTYKHGVTNGTTNGFTLNGTTNHHQSKDDFDTIQAIKVLSIGEQSLEKRRLFVLTHDSERSMSAMATNFKQYLQKATLDDSQILNDLAYTLSTRRSHLAFRVAISATNLSELNEALEKVSKGTTRPQRALPQPNICFAFTGQGAQWARMGQELLRAYPVYAASIVAAEHHLTNLGANWSLLKELSTRSEESRIDSAAISQPICTAIQIALVDLLRTWGIRPTVVCGHSSGEIVAAYTAGFISAHDALSIAFFRGRAVNNLKIRHPELQGGMMAVGISPSQVQPYISRHASQTPGRKVTIACINSPTSVTLSGDKSVLQSIQTDLENDGVFNRLLVVDVAYHSYHMELVQKEYREALNHLRPLQPDGSVRMVSSVSGKEIHAKGVNADYWIANMVSPVLFSEALEGALTLSGDNQNSSRSPVDIVLEIGPHSALAGPIKQILKTSVPKSSSISYHSVLLRNADAAKTAIEMSGELFSLGYNVHFNSINDPENFGESSALTDLPTYNWQHSVSHWSESRISTQYRLRPFARHDLLGIPSSDSVPSEPTWRNYIGLSELPWLSGHVVNDQVIFPASGYICMVLEALRQMTIIDGRMWKNLVCRFREIALERALLIPEKSGVETFLTLQRYSSNVRDASSNWKEFRVFSMSSTGEDTEHCRGLVCVEQRNLDDFESVQELNHLTEVAQRGFEDAKRTCRSVVSVERFYSDLKSVGVSYTGPFANITQINSKPSNSLCTVEIPNTKSCMPGEYQQPHVLHPATLDMCFQTAFPALMGSIKMGSSAIVSSIEELTISSEISSEAGKSLLVLASIQPFGRLKHRATIDIGDSELKNPSLISIKGLALNSTDEISNSSRQSQGTNLCHQIEWGLDTACAKQEDVDQLCQDSLEDIEADTTIERRPVYDIYIRHVIKQVLSVISENDEASMTTHHRKLLNWMRAQQRDDTEKFDPTLRDKVHSLGVDGKMLVNVSDHLVDILTGKIDPITVLMKDDLLYQLYAVDNIQNCHRKLARYLRQLQFKNPRMRILEIGAGTASMSIIALEALAGDPEARREGKEKLDKYVFTDISSGFFEKGQAKLADWGELVEFKKLDIEKSTKEQGFEDSSFDLIIASNVLHATRTMSKTMQNVRKLLKPGGKLALVEITQTHMFWHMTVGTLSGWWLGDEDGRVDSPLLSLSRWDDLLHHTGFSGIDAMVKDYEPVHEHQVSLMISTAKTETEAGHPPAIEIICSDKEKSIADAFSKLAITANQERQISASTLSHADSTGKICIVLLDILDPFLSSCKEAEFEKIKSLFSHSKGILWVTRGGAIEATEPKNALITGLGRTLRSEDHAANFVTLDLDSKTDTPVEIAQRVFEVFRQAFRPAGVDGYFHEFEYAVRNCKVLIPRVVDNTPLETYVQRSAHEQEPELKSLKQPGRSLGLEIQTPGILESLYWTNSTIHSRTPATNEVRVELNMVALNFKDLMNAMGQLPGLSAMLIECSGTVVEVGQIAKGKFKVGDRVCAIHPDGLATTSNIDYHQVQHIPNGMNSDLATAILISYATALYALRDVARIKKGESILIHAAAGALGQAAIALAKYFQAGEIFVTVGTPEKRELIKKHFGIPEENIFSSRTLSFGQGIQRRTHGKGVDMVLNSLSGEATRESQKCLAQFGRFVEVGKKDLLSNARMETQYLEKNATFAAVDLGMVAQHKPSEIQEILGTVVNLVHTGKVQAMHPITVMPISELEAAFRQMQTGKHVGKLILQIDQQSQVQVQNQPPSPPKLKDDHTYLVVGGLGGIGRAIIRHLAELGAKHIATLSRSGAEDENKTVFIQEMHDAGVNLVIQRGSVAEIRDIKKLVDYVGKRTIRGIVQGAMVLQDSALTNMTHAQWQTTLGPKVTGTLNLQSVFGDSLDFFILLSSQCGIIGSYGQGNYSAASTFQDAFARQRTSQNLPARTIDLGVVGSEGYTAENQAAAKHVMRYGVGALSMKELFALVNHAIVHPIANDITTAQVLAGSRPADPTSDTEEAAVQRADPKFSHIWNTRSRQSTTNARTGEVDLFAVLLSATTQDLAVETVLVAIVEKLSRLLGMPTEDISPMQSVSSYGMDSLIAVELRNWVSKKLESYVQTFELMSALTIQELARLIAERSRLVVAGLFSGED